MANNPTKQDALRLVLNHPLHESIKNRIGNDLKKLTKEGDCTQMIRNINAAYKALTPEQAQIVFEAKAEKSILIEKETLYSWAHNEGRISNIKYLLVKLFLGEPIAAPQKTQLRQEKEFSDTEKHAQTVNDSEIRHLSGKMFWAYARLMGAEETIHIENEKRNIKDTMMQSLFFFEKFNPQSKRIKVHCKAYKRLYEGHAYLRKEHIYLALDLKDGEEKKTDERTSYIGTIGKEDITSVKAIRLIRLGLFEGVPIAARSMLIAAEDNLDFGSTEILQRFIPIANIGAHKALLHDYFQDSSNLVLRTTPLKPNDYTARAASLEKKLNRTWNGLLTNFFKNYLDVIKTGAIQKSIEFDIYGKAMYADLFSKIIENLNNSQELGKMPKDCALYATSFASKTYLWQPVYTNYLEAQGKEFLEKGGTIVRFFFVNDLDKDSPEEDQMQVLCRHFELYGNREGNKSGVFLLNQKNISNHHRKMILTEINHGIISWELGVERKRDDITGTLTDIKVSCSQEIALGFKEKFIFFEQQAQNEHSKIARRVTMEDYIFWKEKIRKKKGSSDDL